MLRSAGLADLWSEYLALLVFAAIMLTLAVLRFNKRLD
jgi:ABC-2 type transport system permease protein